MNAEFVIFTPGDVLDLVLELSGKNPQEIMCHVGCEEDLARRIHSGFKKNRTSYVIKLLREIPDGSLLLAIDKMSNSK